MPILCAKTTLFIEAFEAYNIFNQTLRFFCSSIWHEVAPDLNTLSFLA